MILSTLSTLRNGNFHMCFLLLFLGYGYQKYNFDNELKPTSYLTGCSQNPVICF